MAPSARRRQDFSSLCSCKICGRDCRPAGTDGECIFWTDGTARIRQHHGRQNHGRRRNGNRAKVVLNFIASAANAVRLLFYKDCTLSPLALSFHRGIKHLGYDKITVKMKGLLCFSRYPRRRAVELPRFVALQTIQDTLLNLKTSLGS